MKTRFKTLPVPKGRKTAAILLIEDNPGDIVLVQEALKELEFDVCLGVVSNSDDAMDYLTKRGNYPDAPDPDLVILDINLPRKNGLDFLRDLKHREDLRDIPVVVFTTSRSNKDILKTYSLGGVCLITKPLGFYEFMESVRSIITNLVR